ncbi:MAG: DoxX family membrane protein [Candidatus Yonathbacteria bacterium]|nr:DoxX family membrane protein [Candidatus Yonathbacteria bacterium]
MVSLFPQLFDYGFFATGVLRVAVGIILIHLAYQLFFIKRAERITSLEKEGMKPAFLFLSLVSGAKIILGLLLTIGLFTQVATLAISALALVSFLIKKQKPSLVVLFNTNEFYTLLFITSLILAFIGPGAFAFDLPL